MSDSCESFKAHDNPRFSILVPAYNAEATLAETVASVRKQTFDDWELVIVDDGSADSTFSLASDTSVSDARIRVIHQANRGTGGAYNTAVREARADLLVMLSADDLLLPDHLAAMDEHIRSNPEASVFTCDGYFQYEDGRRTLQDLDDRWRDSGAATLVDLCSACFFGIGAVFKREVFDSVGGFCENLYAEDYRFWLLALAHGYRHNYLDVPLSVHRRSSTQKSAHAVLMRQADIAALREIIASGLLSPESLEAAQRSISRHLRVIRVRTMLSLMLGEHLAARIIAAARGGYARGRRQ
ncbi:MAG: glycosyltransferase [Actinobacteria bacterium]|nr:glycosyltransferase [Actinomycetota bacterium]MCL5887002.1 glycosyltransferase [Actinomycetota bacterium]